MSRSFRQNHGFLKNSLTSFQTGASSGLIMGSALFPKSGAMPIIHLSFLTRIIEITVVIYLKRNTQHDPPYWRGPIWMNMNYMILSSLHHYPKEDGPYRERAEMVYNDLSGNLIRYRWSTGCFWDSKIRREARVKVHGFSPAPKLF